MRCYIHIITDQERIVDPDGGEFVNLATARAEACQSARDLMAEELRSGRPVPFAWRAQLADEDGTVMLTLPFAEMVFGNGPAAQMPRPPQPVAPEVHMALIERAKVTFDRARKSHSEIRSGLNELRGHLRTLAQYSGALR
jgi:hypothetical protein